jgi:hypothetical protein
MAFVPLPETTLANPILDAAYAPFQEVYAKVKKGGKNEVERLATLLSHQSNAPGPDVVRRHVTSDTPTLAYLGRMRVPKGVGTEYMDSVLQVVMGQEESIKGFLSEITSSGSEVPSFARIDWESIRQSEGLMNRLLDAIYWLNVIDKIIVASKQKGWARWNGGWFSRRLSLIPSSGSYILCTTDVCLMMKDMMYSRFIIPLYCHLDLRRKHLIPKLEKFEVWGGEVLLQRGNDGYDLIKGIEALTQTAIIAREEKILDGKGQHAAMLSKYKEKEIQVGGTGTLVDQLDLYLQSFDSSRDLAEAFGFLKLWGHPYVFPYEGCISVRDLGKQDLKLRMGDCQKLEWSFCHLYCRGFLRKTGRWPKIRFVDRGELPITKLQALCDKGHPSLAFGFTQYPATDWQWAIFEEHLVFDEGEDILSLVVDKSISHKREHFDATWRGRLPYDPPRSPTSTRVMEELITRPTIDLREIVSVVSERRIPRAWKIVSVCPKEREMKKHPRMFSMMVLEMRLFFVLTEHNIAEGVFKSLPEQTMTLNRQELLDLFLTSTKPTPGSWVRVVMSIDFTKWNTMWRKEAVHPIGRRMDQMFGKEGVFSVVHEFFEECLCLLRLPEYPPDHVTKDNRHDPPEGRSLWYNHRGGFEGITQKLWTSCTIALIHMALWELGLSYRIIGQGDNQVCIIEVYIPPTLTEEMIQTYVRDVVDRAAAEISRVGATVGQEVKP